MITILLGSLIVFKEVDGFIYGVIVTYLMASVMDRIMYGIDEGKMTRHADTCTGKYTDTTSGKNSDCSADQNSGSDHNEHADKT